MKRDIATTIARLFGYNGTNFQAVNIDEITRGLITVSQEHHEAHEGDHYCAVGVQNLSINQVLDFTWMMPNTTKWTHWTWKIDTESETLWQVYEAAVETNPLANTFTPCNNDRNSANTSGTTLLWEVQSNLAAANADTDVTGATLLETGISGAGKDSGSADRSHEMILKQNTLYCLRATASSAGYINFSMQWYEHTGKAA